MSSGGDFLKRLICLFVVLCVIVIFPLSVYADTIEDVESIVDWAAFLFDTTRTLTHTPLGSADFQSYFTNSANAAKYGYYLQQVNVSKNMAYDLYDMTAFKNPLFEFVVDSAFNQGELTAGAGYRAALVNRGVVHSIYDTANHYEYFNYKYFNLDDCGIVLSNNYNVNENIVLNGDGITHLIGGGYLKGWFDVTAAQNYNGVSILHGDSRCPPALYVPDDTILLFHGLQLNTHCLYFLLSDNCIIGVNSSCPALGPYSNAPNGLDSMLFLARDGYISGDDWDYSVGGDYPFYAYSFDGSTVNTICLDYGGAWQYVDLFEKSSGRIIQLGSSVPSAPTIEEPADIPYDDNGYTVICVPVTDNSVNYNGDIIYMDPADVENYINNGQIVQGDYVNDYSSDFTQTVVNNYNNYVTNQESQPFDDTNILSRLDTIIDKLTDILGKLDFTKNETVTDIFSDEPIYIEFGDCVFDNVPLAKDIKTLADNLNVETSSDGLTDISFVDESLNGAVINDSNMLRYMYNNLSINIEWYEPYRERIRNLLKIPCWIFGITTCWAVIRSVFGVKTGGDG